MEKLQTDIVVIGAGPGGYAAAFYARDKNKKVILVDSAERLGGVCLNHGCIPSKALLHGAKLIKEAKESGFRGIHFGEPKINLDEMRAWKNGILDKLGNGIRSLAKKREVETIQGRGYFEDSQTLRVETKTGQQFIEFDKAIIATGSQTALPKAFD
jgi:dihydrolipoamide dehydrogenase